jgi:hypothetical protein
LAPKRESNRQARHALAVAAVTRTARRAPIVDASRAEAAGASVGAEAPWGARLARRWRGWKRACVVVVMVSVFIFAEHVSVLRKPDIQILIKNN